MIYLFLESKWTDHVVNTKDYFSTTFKIAIAEISTSIAAFGKGKINCTAGLQDTIQSKIFVFTGCSIYNLLLVNQNKKQVYLFIVIFQNDQANLSNSSKFFIAAVLDNNLYKFYFQVA